MSDSDTLSLRQMWAQTTDVLGARHEARWICEVAVSLDGKEFDEALDERVTERMVAHLDAMVARYRTGEPLQYVLGRWGFRHLDLAIDRRVLIPRPETEILVDVALDRARSFDGPLQLADLGTGSGAIGLSLAAELPLVGTTVWITDVSAEALEVARANLTGIGRGATNVLVGEGSWFEALPVGERFHVIASNPPYVADDSPELDASVLEWEPASALFAGGDGLDDIRHLVARAPDHLVEGGWLILEIGADQGDAVRALLTDAGYGDVEIRADLAGHDRIAIGNRRS